MTQDSLASDISDHVAKFNSDKLTLTSSPEVKGCLQISSRLQGVILLGAGDVVFRLGGAGWVAVRQVCVGGQIGHVSEALWKGNPPAPGNFERGRCV